MSKKIIWMVLSCLMVVALVLSSCRAAPEPGEKEVVEGEVEVKEAAKVEEEKEKAAEEEAAPKIDTGPQYGGVLSFVTSSLVNMDPYRFDGGGCYSASFPYEKLIIGDWAIDRDEFDFPVSRGSNVESILIGSLAESFEMPDPSTIILHMRGGVRYHNKAPTWGREFTVDDVIYNINWWRESTFIDRQFSDMIEEVVKVDNKTVQLNLKQPSKVNILVGVLDNDSHFFIAEESRDTPSGEIEDWRTIAGTGPFILTDVVPDSALRYVRNPDYWGFDEKYPQNQLPYVDEVRYLIIPDITMRLAALRTGKIDILLELGMKDTLTLQKSNPELKTRLAPSHTPRALRMRWDLEPFTDIRIRQAVSMAIDRQAIVDSMYSGYALYYSGLLKPFHIDVYTPFEELPEDIQEILTYNPEKAKQLLVEAGFPDGFTCDLNIGPDPDFSELAQITQQYLKAIGIDVEIKRNEWAEFNAIRYGKQHKAMIIHWNSFYAQPLQLFEWFADPTHKFGLSAVDDPVFTAMYEKATQTFDSEERSELIRELDYYSLRDVFFATFPNPQVGFMWTPWLGGYQGEGMLGNFNFGALAARLWVIEDLKD